MEILTSTISKKNKKTLNNKENQEALSVQAQMRRTNERKPLWKKSKYYKLCKLLKNIPNNLTVY